MSEKRKWSVDKEKSFAALVTDLSEAFDCLLHDVITAELNASGFNFSTARLNQNHLSNRKQRPKINNVYNSWEVIHFGVPQGSILGPLSSNIFMSELF